MRRFSMLTVILLAFLTIQCQSQSKTKVEAKKGGSVKTMKLTSSVFEEGSMIPSKYTCDGADVSPPLAWSDVPDKTKSFALISDDPDAPMGTWVHWVIYNIPDSVRQLPEGVPADEKLKNGAVQGTNDFRRIGYGGPCPPSGVHRYYFKLYALDTMLNLKPGATKAELLKAMEGHILGKTELMGKYSRK
ncbi:MAG: YbhB/YbcL family Raf kinase inhibitor-like protein [Calditrichaeota bacterium]|nr:YbhB/YbcL family Raf kinase inhibitor-like protein [Calditrichota bacterium]